MNTANQTCRNCSGNEFILKNIKLSSQESWLLPVAFWPSSYEVELRVCGKCGLMDWFVSSGTLEDLRRKS
jgi:hypothetical protein